jgi:cell division protein YceG involved in septum cleavage
MNKATTSFYVVNKDNCTVAFGSNLKEMVAMFSKVEPSARVYQYYYRQFKAHSTFTEGEYTFQQLV